MKFYFFFSGSCTGLVIRTGDNTVMGRIAALGKWNDLSKRKRIYYYFFL